MNDIPKRLAEPFAPNIVSFRVGPTTKDKTKGMALAYIDARDVMRRLDEVCGPENWQDEYPWSDGKRVVCRIGIKIDLGPQWDGDQARNREWVWKTDGAGDTDTEGEKGALSDAFKRAAVKWGVGRYLYDVEAPWVEIEQRGQSYVIKQSELPRLRANLPAPRRHNPAGEARAAAPAPPQPTAPPAETPFDAPPAPIANGRVSDQKLREAAEARDRIRAALLDAKEPRLIEDIITNNGADLRVIKEVGPKIYESLMTLANGRKQEMLAGA